MRGVKPQQAAVKKLHASRERINDREPVPVGNVAADPPAHFDEEQAEVWRYAVEHSPTGMLKLIDASVLETWCVAHVMHRQAVVELQKAGSLMVETPNHLLVQSPYIPIINKQAEILTRAANALGFVPTTRPKIGLSGGGELGASYVPSETEESLQEYLARSPLH